MEPRGNPPATQIEGFRKIVFPRVKVSEIEPVLARFYGMEKQEVRELVEANGGSIEKIFAVMKRKAKRDDYVLEDLIEVDDIEDMNELSHEAAEADRRKLLAKLKQKEGTRGRQGEGGQGKGRGREGKRGRK